MTPTITAFERSPDRGKGQADIHRRPFDVRLVPTKDIETTVINQSALLRMR
jgi:hypothetical protein